MPGQFYDICNCCSCCCGAMQSFQGGTPMLASSGCVAQVDDDLCAACGLCTDYCQFAAISVDDDFAHIDTVACMGCGVCVAHCPQEVIELVRDPNKGTPLEIQKLIARAAETAQNRESTLDLRQTGQRFCLCPVPSYAYLNSIQSV